MESFNIIDNIDNKNINKIENLIKNNNKNDNNKNNIIFEFYNNNLLTCERL